MKRLIEIYSASKTEGISLLEFQEGVKLLQKEIQKKMPTTCKGCNTTFNEDIWLHPALKICSICYHQHIHSKNRAWDEIGEEWVDITLEKEVKSGSLDKWIQL